MGLEERTAHAGPRPERPHARADWRQMLGIGRTKAYELISQSKLRTATIGRRRVIFVASIEALLEAAAA